MEFWWAVHEAEEELSRRQPDESTPNMSALERWEADIDRRTGRPPLFSDN